MSTGKSVPFKATLHVRDHCLCLAAQRGARAVARRFDEALRPLDLTNRQFSLLMSLNRPEPPSIGAVANLLVMDRTTLTANIKPLERRGLLKTAVDPNDRRGRLLSLTTEGHRLLLAALPVWQQTHQEVESRLQTIDAEALRAGLGELVYTAATFAHHHPG